MNLLFIQGGSRWKYDSEGTLYTDPNFNSQIWSRYKGYCDELTVVLRREDRIYTKEEARIKFNEIGNSIDHCVALPDMYRPLSNALSCQKRMLVKRTIESEVKKADKVIIRSLGNIYTNTALKYAQKYHKPYLVEVTGFAWESLWYHSLHGKFVAGFKEKQYKRLMKNVKYGVYVTNEALQKRYPCKGEMLGCSDVELSSFVQQINKITKGFAYAFLFVFVNNIFAQKTKTERIANFANLIPGVLFSAQCILKGGRFPVVAFIIGAFFLYYYFWRRTKGWGKVIPVKYIVRIVMIIAGVIAAFWFSKELVGRLSKDNDLMGYVTRYFGGGPVLFELYLKDSSMLHDAPNETFAGLISSLNKFGFNLTGRAYHEFRAASGITIGNAYSALRNYYHDYSIFGVILFNYILAFVFSIKYYDLKYCSDITYKKAFSLTLYASFIYTVFFQFFTDYFFARLSVGLFIEVIFLRICFWFVMRLKVCFGRR